jgi:4-carboxymuconolactone decarboxylase
VRSLPLPPLLPIETLPQLKAHTATALNIGVEPVEIREVVYQLAAFIGYPKVLNALDTINAVLNY